MPMRRDGDRRWIEMEFLVPGTPDQVWNAIATGPGISAWFMAATVEEKIGGTIAFDFAEAGASSGKVTGWQPPHRFTYEEYGWAGEAPPLATEMTVTARSGGTCVVRLVHSLFTSKDDWDDQFGGFEMGWPGFFEVLRVYLANFAGAKAAPMRASGVHDGTEAEAWVKLTERLGLAGANLDETRGTPDGAPGLAGTVEHVRQDRKSREIMLRLEKPANGIALVGTHRWENRTRAAVSIFFYGDEAKKIADREEPRWKDWMKENFPGDGE